MPVEWHWNWETDVGVSESVSAVGRVLKVSTTLSVTPEISDWARVESFSVKGTD